MTFRFCFSLLLLLALALPVHAASLTKAPELLTFVEAPFPASEAGKTASVVLAITIREDGTVEDVTVQESAGEAFDAAAVAAARGFIFSPAEIDGKASRIRILYRYDFVEKIAAPTTAIFSGVVKDRFAHTVLPEVTIRLSDGRSAVTDVNGYFEFKYVAPGVMTITLEGARLTALSTEETFVAGEHLETVYEVEPLEEGAESDDMEILVVAPTIKKQAISTEIPADEARRVPGTDGDVLRVVENLPGVARAALGTGALVVWGAAPQDTGVYIDGVPVPRLYHDGGLRSVVGPDFIKTVTLVPGGYGAAHGRGLGGLVTASTNDFSDALHGAVAADIYDTAVSLHGPVNKSLNMGLAGRYGYVGPLLSRAYPGVEDYFPVPHYYDAQARLGWVLGEGESLNLTGLISSDHTQSTAASADPAREASERKSLQFQRVYLAYNLDIGDGKTISATGFVGGDQSLQQNQFGQVITDISRQVTLGGLRASYRSRLNTYLTVEGGIDSLISTFDVQQNGSVAVPAREGDVRVFGQPPPDQIASDQFQATTINAAPYVETEVALFEEKLNLLLGLRADPNIRMVSQAQPQVGISPTHGLFEEDFKLEPRLVLRYSPTTALSFMAAYGQYHAQPEATDLSASFGNPLLPATEGTHYVAGSSFKPIEALSFEFTGFYTHSEQLAVRSAVEQPSLAEALEATGQGRSYGGQALIRLDPTHGFFGWMSYTLAWSERQDAVDLPWRPSDYDQRHAWTGLLGWLSESAWEAGLRARVATGYPRSSVVGAYQDNRRDLYMPLFGGQNDIRLPTFFQMDVRVAKTFDIRDSKLETSFEIQNVTNQSNVEEYLYNADYSEQGAIEGLPILPVLGLRWSF